MDCSTIGSHETLRPFVNAQRRDEAALASWHQWFPLAHISQYWYLRLRPKQGMSPTKMPKFHVKRTPARVRELVSLTSLRMLFADHDQQYDGVAPSSNIAGECGPEIKCCRPRPIRAQASKHNVERSAVILHFKPVAWPAKPRGAGCNCKLQVAQDWAADSKLLVLLHQCIHCSATLEDLQFI